MMNHMTESEKVLAFVSFCIEEYKNRIGSDGRRVAILFEKSGVIDFLMEHYDTLHSLGREAILAEIEDFLSNRKRTE